MIALTIFFAVLTTAALVQADFKDKPEKIYAWAAIVAALALCTLCAYLERFPWQ